ncbi:hypothetical protein TRVA0_009S02476 [Trichomonascus vanleenenianus]|uniref:uncharacterized protein n=1 Tax=Trichomonascus vanleenenianus TaxID=2268995 RepID=UPI003ECB50ED
MPIKDGKKVNVGKNEINEWIKENKHHFKSIPEENIVIMDETGFQTGAEDTESRSSNPSISIIKPAPGSQKGESVTSMECMHPCQWSRLAALCCS